MKRTWLGKYGYINDDDETGYFTFKMNVEIIDGSFEGAVYEEEFSGVTNDLVAVKGFITHDFISFVKTYPYYWAIDDDHFIYDKSAPGHEVVYEGNFDEINGVWRGEWEIELDRKVVDKETDKISLLTGVWEMKAKL